MMPKRRLSNDPESMFNMDAKPAPTKDPSVDPKLFIDMKSANKVPSIPGGQSCPDKIRKGINLQFFPEKKWLRFRTNDVAQIIVQIIMLPATKTQMQQWRCPWRIKMHWKIDWHDHKRSSTLLMPI